MDRSMARALSIDSVSLYLLVRRCTHTWILLWGSAFLAADDYARYTGLRCTSVDFTRPFRPVTTSNKAIYGPLTLSLASLSDIRSGGLHSRYHCREFNLSG